MVKRISVLMITLVLILTAAFASAAKFDPHHATAFMEIKFECGCSRCGTGAMISRYGLITAGHNLFCGTHGKKLKSCSFLFGAKSPNSGKYRYSGKYQYWAYDTFANGYNSENDIGYVVFNSPVGNSTGWFGYWAGSDDDLDVEFSHVLTYSDKARIDELFTVQYVLNSNELYWEDWQYGGEGGPVFLYSSDEEECYVVGVYTSHNASENWGYGRRLTQNIINDMKESGAFR